MPTAPLVLGILMVIDCGQAQLYSSSELVHDVQAGQRQAANQDQPRGLLDIMITVEPSVVETLGNRDATTTFINRTVALLTPIYARANVQVSSVIEFWPDQRVAYNRNGSVFVDGLMSLFASDYLPRGADMLIHITSLEILIRGRVTRATINVGVCTRQAVIALSQRATPTAESNLEIDQNLIYAIGLTIGLSALRLPDSCDCSRSEPCWMSVNRVPLDRGKWASCSLRRLANIIRSPAGECLTRTGPPPPPRPANNVTEAANATMATIGTMATLGSSTLRRILFFGILISVLVLITLGGAYALVKYRPRRQPRQRAANAKELSETRKASADENDATRSEFSTFVAARNVDANRSVFGSNVQTDAAK